MENASKALLIAGAILIAILLIAVGMMVFGGAQSNIEASIASMSSQEKEAFNSQFTMYQGNNKSATSVKTLLNKLIATNSDPDAHHVKITTVDYQDAGGNNITGINNVVNNSAVISNAVTDTLNSRTYNVLFGYTDGLITSVTITMND